MRTTPTAPENREPRWTIRLRAYAWVLAVGWTACMAGSLWWSLSKENAEFVDEARTTATLSVVQDMLYRRLAAKEGAESAISGDGVSLDPGHPFHPHEVSRPPGLPLGAAAPSSMASNAYEISPGMEMLRSHLVSLKPIRPENAPDSWEAQGLRAF